MWSFFRNLLARSPSLNILLGDVAYTTTAEKGLSKRSFVEWYVKRPVKGAGLYVSAKMIPDGYAGPEGSPTNYISFDLDTAIRLRDHLDECIDVVRRHSATSPK
jgi:hypothetical protein